ncbi:HIRAN domain-containing protein [Agrobacterium vitis]|uniref:HIRAN domain-containing protein n=1 Tax=Agrobacterium vitis TaxID=373 RepID=UPI001F3E0DDB|nr:HIRAN domain-containing protein [Agrobacterium vitis]
MEQFSGTAHPAAGEEMVLRRNTDRQFDPRSIEVRTEMSQVLGYLPPAFSGMLATIMDDGHPAFAVAIEGGDSSQMNVEIFLDMRA